MMNPSTTAGGSGSGMRSDRVAVKAVDEGSSRSTVGSPKAEKKKDDETGNPMFDFI